MTKIPAITIWQPWATLIAIEAKRYETRSWTRDYRGPLAIHAATKWNRYLRELCQERPFADVLARAGYNNPDDLPLGKVVAVVDWVGSHRSEDLLPQLYKSQNKQEARFGDYSAGRYGWEFCNVRKLAEPVTAVGRQQLWTWEIPSEIEALVINANGVIYG